MEKTLIKGLTVLEALAFSSRPRGIAELAKELGMPRSNVFRLLQTLLHQGYVRRNTDPPRYECTMRLFELGSFLVDRMDIKSTAEPHLRALVTSTEESAHLSILDGREVLYIAKVESFHPIRAYARVGGRAPVHCVATGKALLAFEADDFVASLMPLTRYTPRTIVDPIPLAAELERIRRRGYAVNNGEWREGVVGIAAPIFGLARRPVAALSISGPVDRLRPASVRRYSPMVVAAAKAISESLGLISNRPESPQAGQTRG